MKTKIIYFVRHAPTKANLSGEMVKDYDKYDILPFNKNIWWNNVDKIFPDLKQQLLVNKTVLVSKAARTSQTAHELFGNISDDTTENPYIWDTESLNEFDCSGLGDKKFWEISEEEFNQSVKLTSKKMQKQTKQMIYDILNTPLPYTSEKEQQAIVCVSHGMKIRYLIWYLSGRKDITPYKVINSMEGIKFNNLDVLKAEFKKTIFGWKLKDMKFFNLSEAKDE